MSFVRSGQSSAAGGRGVCPAGCRPQGRCALSVTSAGVAELDVLYAGGHAVGATHLIEENGVCAYSSRLAGYFLAEGVLHEHSLCVLTVQPQSAPHTNLPAPVTSSGHSATDAPPAANPDDPDLRIAWRYAALPQANSNLAGQNQSSASQFDLAQPMPDALLSKCALHVFDVSQPDKHQSAYTAGLARLQQLLHQPEHCLTADGPKRLLRIVVDRVGSPLWGEPAELPRFLYLLRAMVRRACATCLVTLPHQQIPPALHSRLYQMCDCAIRLEGFSGTDKEKNPVFSKYHGQVHIKKLVRINSLAAQPPSSFDLVFKLRRNRLQIETFHLPAEFPSSDGRAAPTKTLDF